MAAGAPRTRSSEQPLLADQRGGGGGVRAAAALVREASDLAVRVGDSMAAAAADLRAGAGIGGDRSSRGGRRGSNGSAGRGGGGGGGAAGGAGGASLISARVDFVPTFMDLSQDNMLEVLSFLPGTDVGRCAAVSRGMRDAVNDQQLWRQLFWTEFQTVFGSRLSLRVRDARQVYKERVVQRQTRIRNRTRVREAYQKRLAAVPGQKNMRRALDCWHIGVAMACPMICVLLFSVLLALNLDAPGEMDWQVVFSPWYGIFGIAVVAICLACVARCRDRHDAPSSVWHGTFDTHHNRHIAKVLLTDILGDRVRSNLVCTLVAIPWLLSPVFIALKLNGDLGDTNWGTTLTPLWLALIMTCCCLPLVVDDLDGGGCFAWMSVFTGGMCPIWVTLVLLAIRLDGADIPAHMVLMPWWIIDGLFALVAVFGCLITTCVMVRRDERAGIPAMWGACMLSVIVVGPLIAFHILLSLKDAGVIDPTWSGVFAPLWAYLSFLVCIGCAACSATLNESCRSGGYHDIQVERPPEV